DVKREHTVSVRLNVAELAQLDQVRGAVGMQRGEYLRAAALHRLPPTIPALNREAWAGLSRSAANLNQIAHRLNLAEHNDKSPMPAIGEIAQALGDFRRRLIGVESRALDEMPTHFDPVAGAR
ncbi:MAG: plasmid mobilization relaxosome protein MobC, partial [Oxalobacteraceae bacterium]